MKIEVGTFLNLHATAVVVLGSVFAFFATLGWSRAVTVMRLATASFMRRAPSAREISDQILRLGKAHRDRSVTVNEILAQCDPFLKEGFALISDGMIDGKGVSQLLQARVYTDFQVRSAILNRLARFTNYPVTVGLIAALGAAVALVHELLNPAGGTQVPDLLSFGMLSLVYGSVLSYFVVAPLAQKLAEDAKTRRQLQSLIVVGCRLMSNRTNPIVIAEEMNSYLPAHERVDWRDVAVSAPTEPAA